MEPSKLAWTRISCVVLALFMAAVLVAGAGVIAKQNNVSASVHKVEHVLYYGCMAALLAFAFGRRRLWYAVLAVSLVGALDEWHQLSVPGRRGSPYDWLIDTAAAMLAVYVVQRVMTATERRRNDALATRRA